MSVYLASSRGGSPPASDTRGAEDVGMLDNAGWKRAWAMISGGIFVLMIVLALKNPNVLNVSTSSSSLDCVPGTYSESSGRPEHVLYQPTQEQVEDRAGQTVSTSPSGIMSVDARARNERRAPRYDQVTTFSCTSYLRLVFAFVAAAFLSIGIAVMFRISRWLYGFRKN
jgi:hypothetical protein